MSLFESTVVARPSDSRSSEVSPAVLASLLLPVFVWVCSGATLVVDKDGGGDFVDIQAALDAAREGDTILVMPGVYSPGRLIFNRNLEDPDSQTRNLRNLVFASAAGPEETILKGVYLELSGVGTEGVQIRGFTLDGDHTARTAISVEGSEGIVLEDCKITNYTGMSIIRVVNSRLIVKRSVMRGGAEQAYWSFMWCNGSEICMENCLVTGNRPQRGWASGALEFSGCRARLVNCTIAGNRGGDPGVSGISIGQGVAGILVTDGFFVGSEVTLQNCILWDNGRVSLWVGQGCTVSLSHCVIDDAEIWAKDYSQVGVDNCLRVNPLFVAPEKGDYRLRPDSPLVNNGLSRGVPTEDLEGNPRVCWGGVDIGAYEYCGGEEPRPAPQFIRGDVNADGTVDISDAVELLRFKFAGSEEPDCSDAGDANDDGVIDLGDVITVLGYLFGGQDPAGGLGGGCVADLTEDALSCDYYGGCGELSDFRPNVIPP